MPMNVKTETDETYIRLAIRLAKRAEGLTSPNPIVGAVLVKDNKIVGKGYHKRAGLPHAEIEAIKNAKENGFSPEGSTLYVTLEPCSTYGRTPPCVEAIIREKIKKVVVGATDPNPSHAGKAYEILSAAGIDVVHGVLESQCAELNEGFNHWIVYKTPYVILKSAMTLDGKIATESGESKWITGEAARQYSMRLRKLFDAILVGVNTIIADNPELTYRGKRGVAKSLRRIILDSNARTPISSKVVSDNFSHLTTIFVTETAPKERVDLLKQHCNVIVAPQNNSRVDIQWVLKKLGEEGVLTLLIEGGGEVNASFLQAKAVHRIIFFYAPKILCGFKAPRSIAGEGFNSLNDVVKLESLKWQQIGNDLMLNGLVRYS